MSTNLDDKTLYETVRDCFFMIQMYDYQRIANHKLTQLVEEYGKEKITTLMEKAQRKSNKS